MSAFTRVHDLLPRIEKQFMGEVFIAGKQQGQWITYSKSQFLHLVDETSRGLLASGIQRNDRVAIMSTNRPEWNMCDLAIVQIGAVLVPMYPTLSEQDIRFILKDAEVKFVFAGSKELVAKLSKVKKDENLDLIWRK